MKTIQNVIKYYILICYLELFKKIVIKEYQFNFIIIVSIFVHFLI